MYLYALFEKVAVYSTVKQVCPSDSLKPDLVNMSCDRGRRACKNLSGLPNRGTHFHWALVFQWAPSDYERSASANIQRRNGWIFCALL